MADDDIRVRFFRERRLLLAISVVLLAHQCLGITVAKSADTLGLHFDIADPAKIWWLVWAIWLWTAICILQQMNSLDLKSTYPTASDQATRTWLSNRIATWSIRGPALRHLREAFYREQELHFTVKWAGRSEVDGPARERLIIGNVEVSCRWPGRDATAATAKVADLDAALDKMGLTYGGGSSGCESGYCFFTKVVKVRVIPIEQRPLVCRISKLWTLMSTSFSSDYLLPLLIGFAPIAVEGARCAIKLCKAI